MEYEMMLQDNNYEQVQTMTKRRNSRGYPFGDNPNEDLNRIEGEIKLRIKITNGEIFHIGELLTKAKPICQQLKLSFKDWISTKFEFSYETAKNFMNVYKNCIGVQVFAEKLPPSILYKIAAPGFPDELRDYLIVNGGLKEMTNGRFSKVKELFEAEGMEAVENLMEQSQIAITDFILIEYIQENVTRLQKYLWDFSEKTQQDIGLETENKAIHNFHSLDENTRDTIENLYLHLNSFTKELENLQQQLSNIMNELKQKALPEKVKFT